MTTYHKRPYHFVTFMVDLSRTINHFMKAKLLFLWYYLATGMMKIPVLQSVTLKSGDQKHLPAS